MCGVAGRSDLGRDRINRPHVATDGAHSPQYAELRSMSGGALELRRRSKASSAPWCVTIKSLATMMSTTRG